MTRHLRAHYDGRVLVPDQPVDLPVNQPLEIEVTRNGSRGGHGSAAGESTEIEERRRLLRESAGVFSAPVLSDEAMRRESMYDDRL